MRKVTTFVAVAATALVIGAAGVYAHGGASGIVKTRMGMMGDMGKSMKEIAAMMRGKKEYDAQQVRAHATAIAAHGGKKMTTTFPEGSIMPPSEALPSIWRDWEKFSLLANDITKYAKVLVLSAGNERGAKNADAMSGSSSMMQSDQTMAGGSGGMMMRKDDAGPDEDSLAQMAPDAAFAKLVQTCAQCHKDFRQGKN